MDTVKLMAEVKVVRRWPISSEPVPLREAVRESLDLIAPLATERGVRFQNHVAGTSSHVLADRQRLKQVLLNLLSNADIIARARPSRSPMNPLPGTGCASW